MAVPLSAAAVLSALKGEGVRHVEHRSWKTHNRNHKGSWGGVNGVMIHHTAGVGSGMVDFCYNGTADLPGPLCHAVATKDGHVHLVGHGRANHAGSIARNAHDAVVAESSNHPRPDVSEPVDGNRHYYGIEIVNKGDGKDPYPAAQYEQAVRWAAALCRAHGWSQHSVIGHGEGTRRKIDPSFDMGQFRTDVANQLKGQSDLPKPPSEEDDMPEHVLYDAHGYVRTIPADQWTWLNWSRRWDPVARKWIARTPEPSWLFGPVTFQAHGAVRLRGLEPGDEVQLRLQRFRRTADDTGWERGDQYPIDSPVHASGGAHFTYSWGGRLVAARRERLRLEVLHFQHAAPVVADFARVEALTWGAS